MSNWCLYLERKFLFSRIAGLGLRRVNVDFQPLGDPLVIANTKGRELFFEQFDDRIILMKPKPCISIDYKTGVESKSSYVNWPRFAKWELMSIHFHDGSSTANMEEMKLYLKMIQSLRHPSSVTNQS